MSTIPSNAATSADQPRSSSPPTSSPPTTQSSAVRLIVLLGLLGLAIGALIYDYAVAGPGVDAAEKKLSEFVDTRNRLGVKEGGQVTPDDVHKELGMQPTWVDKHDKEHYEVEYYCWRGHVPVLNMWKHYISIVYVGDGKRRISSHYKNEVPPREALPIVDEAPPSADDQPVPPLETPGGSPAKAAADGDKGADAPATKSSDAPTDDK
jgi:hypothetical protein